MPSDDTQFIIESNEELPDENAIHDVPELHNRQEILFEDGGAVEIDHIGRKTAETKVGERGRILG
jgi:hypothetical protein